MKILLLGLNYAPEPIGIGPYTTGLAEALAECGHEVRVVAGQPYYPDWQARPGRRGWRSENTNGVRIDRVPHYIPRQPTGVRRLLHHASFSLAAAPVMLGHAIAWRPDRVIAIAPSLMAAPLALLCAWLSGASSWLHIQDFELEAAFATGFLGRGRGLLPVMGRAESRILQNFDRVSTISPAMRRRLMQKGVKPERVAEHRNWADLAGVKPLQRPSSYRETWKIETPYVALYSGALGQKQGLDLVIAAARQLAHRRDLTFVISGNGPYRRDLEAMAEGFANVRFVDLQPCEQLGELLGLATLHLLPQVAGAADLVLPSKLTNMLASGRPLVATTEPGTGISEEISGCGLAVPPGDAKALVKAIEALCDNPVLAATLGQAARRRAEAHWQREVILFRFVNEIESLGTRSSSAIFSAGQTP